MVWRLMARRRARSGVRGAGVRRPYHLTHDGSVNLLSKVRKRLSLGTEGLYGFEEQKDRRESDVLRFQPGMVYSILARGLVRAERRLMVSRRAWKT